MHRRENQRIPSALGVGRECGLDFADRSIDDLQVALQHRQHLGRERVPPLPNGRQQLLGRALVLPNRRSQRLGAVGAGQNDLVGRYSRGPSF